MGNASSELIKVALTDERYAVEAYEFLTHALTYTQKLLGRTPPKDAKEPVEGMHVSGPELLEGIRQFGLQQFGMMAYVVFRMWGVRHTSDFGAMVYRLIDAGLWHKSPGDRLEDFDDLYDFEREFVRNFEMAPVEI